MNRKLNIDDYSYELPEERIAKYPLPVRDASKLLIYEKGRISHRLFRDLPYIVSREDLMVFNNTRVVQARLNFEKSTGSKIEVFCLEPHEPADYNLAFQSTSGSVWKCLVGNARKWKEGELEKSFLQDGKKVSLSAVKLGRDKDAFLIQFRWDPPSARFGTVLEAGGATPIPPYLNRKAAESDRYTYQTVYSRTDGSVAAPTAGLHFTPQVLARLKDKGIPFSRITLHVGAGTFQPVIAGDLEAHPMHAEHFFVSRSAIDQLLQHKGRTLAVGTTSTRVLESLFWIGSGYAKDDPEHGNVLFLDQWEAYCLTPLSRQESLENLLRIMDRRKSESLEGLTKLMIVPGYSFRMTDLLLTNYHQSRSTLLLLVAALIGEDWRRVYDYALKNGFRFLSYGDSSLLIR